MKNTKIEWTDKTWNPVTGCSKISPGCLHCYAEVMSRRLMSMGQNKYRNGFAVTLHPQELDRPLMWKKSCKIFVCSMSDLFHESVSDEFIDQVISVICNTPQHIYQILTKRAQRMQEFFSKREVPNNVWLGVTVECKKSLMRIDYLRKIQAKVRYLSCEPLLEDLGYMDLEKIHWVIVGGESGCHARPMDEKWVLSIFQQCKNYNVKFFFKQWGTWGADGIKRSKNENGKELQGQIIQEYPL